MSLINTVKNNINNGQFYHYQTWQHHALWISFASSWLKNEHHHQKDLHPKTKKQENIYARKI